MFHVSDVNLITLIMFTVFDGILNYNVGNCIGNTCSVLMGLFIILTIGKCIECLVLQVVLV